MNPVLRLTAVAAVAVVAVVGSLYLFGGSDGGGVGSGPTITPSASLSASPTRSVRPSQTAELIDSWLDTSTWTTYVSERYQFTIGHPRDLDGDRIHARLAPSDRFHRLG